MLPRIRLNLATQSAVFLTTSTAVGIETTATYIPETDELELHTPHANATKWWVGQMVR
jgi:hypothetical protein